MTTTSSAHPPSRERSVAKSPSRQVAKSPSRQVAKSPSRQVAKTPSRQDAKTPRRQDAATTNSPHHIEEQKQVAANPQPPCARCHTPPGHPILQPLAYPNARRNGYALSRGSNVSLIAMGHGRDIRADADELAACSLLACPADRIRSTRSDVPSVGGHLGDPAPTRRPRAIHR
jgi:hypothetical protein